jgi:hypothetical protein
VIPTTHEEILAELIKRQDAEYRECADGDHRRSVRTMMLTLMKEASDLALEIQYFAISVELHRRGIITNVEVEPAYAPADVTLWSPWRLGVRLVRPLSRLLHLFRRTAGAGTRQHEGLRRGEVESRPDPERERWAAYARHVKPN